MAPSWARVLVKDPALHAMQFDVDSAEYCDGAQAVHSEDPGSTPVFVSLPGAQGMQSVDPGLG